MTSDCAWSTPATRRAWGLASVWALVWLVAGLSLLVAFVMYTSTVEGGADDLRTTGVRTTALALADQPESLRCGQVPVPIRYTVAGVTHTRQLFVDGCGDSVHAGDRFTVYVDASNPTRFVTDFSENESSIAVIAAIAAVLGGLVLVTSSIVRALRLVRVLRTLHSGPWTETDVRIVSIPGMVVRSHRIVAMGSRGDLVLIKLPFTLGDNANFPPSGSFPMVAVRGIRGRWALSKDVGGRPVGVKELSSARLRSRVMEELGEPHT